MNRLKFHFFFITFILATALNVYCANPEPLKKVCVGIYQYKPLVYIEKDKRPTGLFIDLIQYIDLKNNWKISYKVGTWQENLSMLKEGKIDLVLGIVMNKSRSQEFDLNKEPIISSWAQVYTAQRSSIKTILDLDNKTIIALKGDSYFPAFKEAIKNFNIHPKYIEKDNIKDVFQEVNNNPNDFALSEWIAGLSYKNEYSLTETPVMLAPSGMGFGTMKGKNDDLLSSIDKYILREKTISNSNYQIIIHKWLKTQNEWQMPVLIKRGLIVGSLLILFSLIVGLISRFQVRRKTRALSLQNKQLHEKEKALNEWALIFKHSNWGVFVANRDNKTIDLMNPAFANMHGYSVDEFTDKPLISSFSLTPGSVIEGEIQKAHQSGHYIFESMHHRKDGSAFPVQVDISNFKSLDDENEITVVNVQDITQRKKAEQDLENSISLLQATLQATADGILVVDNDGNISGYNKRFLKMWHIPEEAILGIDDTRLMNIISDQLKDPEAFKRKVEEIYTQHHISNFDEFELVDGRVFERYSRLQFIDDEPVGRVWSFRDVTERVQMVNAILSREKELATSNEALKALNEEYMALNEEYLTINEELLTNQNDLQKINTELESAKKRAEGADHLKSAFLSNMSHEIRTPMNAIIGFSDLLDMPDLSEKERQAFIKIIKQRGNDLLNLINDILDISKIESGQLNINESVTDINDLFNEIHQIFDHPDHFTKSKGIDLIYHNELPDQKSSVILDANRIKQIILNLIGNAYKFTENGSIEYGCFLKNRDILFYVKDSGIGIPANKLSIIFERFRQVNESYLNNTKGGAGLGLSISKGLIDLMGGKIWAESEVGLGSTFWFSIPYKYHITLYS